MFFPKAVALVTALWRRRIHLLAFLYAPVLLALAFVLPSNGMWRLHFLFPLLCAAMACALAEWRRPVRSVTLAVGLLAGAITLLPPAPGPHLAQ